LHKAALKSLCPRFAGAKSRKKRSLTWREPVFFSVIIALVIAVVAALNVNFNLLNEQLSAIGLENVEALADEEQCSSWLGGTDSLGGMRCAYDTSTGIKITGCGYSPALALALCEFWLAAGYNCSCEPCN